MLRLARISLPLAFAIAALCLAGALAALLAYPARAQSPPTCPDPTPTAVDVTAVPIVVTSSTADYFVLYVSHDVDGTEVDLPVLVKRGEAGTTTLAENVEALPAERYRVEKYLIADPADVDGDCVDDITELGDPVGMSPVNAAAAISFSDGATSVPDLDTYLEMAKFRNAAVDSKFIVLDRGSARPGLVFINANTHQTHQGFLDATGIESSGGMFDGFLTYDVRMVASDGSLGAWYVWISEHLTFTEMERMYAFVAANLPALSDNLYVYIPVYKLGRFEGQRQLYEESRMDVLFDDDVSSGAGVDFLNTGVGFGRLRVMDAEGRPHPREIVIYETVPNELPRVAGIITTA